MNTPETLSAGSLHPACSAAPVECEEAVIEKIRLRRNAGRKKYGMTMERDDLNKLQWLQHAQEEAMDLAIYLERLMREERQNVPDQRPNEQPKPLASQPHPL